MNSVFLETLVNVVYGCFSRLGKKEKHIAMCIGLDIISDEKLDLRPSEYKAIMNIVVENLTK